MGLKGEQEEKTEERLRVILEHLAGRKTATESAIELGISRKTFYEWLGRATEAMRCALTDRPGGRPPNPVDEEKEQLRTEVKELEKERLVLEGRLRIQEAVRQTLEKLQVKESEPKKK